MDDPVEVPITDTFDLHSFRPPDVPAAVEEYLVEALKRRFAHVRIIHGRGIGVQRAIVRSLLEKHPDVVSFQDADDRGSTTIRLRGVQ